MLFAGRVRGSLARSAFLSLTGVLLIAGVQSPAGAKPAQPRGAAVPPAVAGLGQVATPQAKAPKALPKRTGTVAVNPNRTVAPNSAKSAGKASAPAAAAADVQTLAASTNKVALRALVIAVDSADFGLPTWQATLDRVGASYDVLYSSTTPLTASQLVRADGVGKYNAILLTNSMQLYGASYTPGFDTTEWNTLWAYERDYGVRQATLFTSYGSWPEDHCLRGVSETSIGDTPVNAALTSTGAPIFDYLASTAQIPLVQTYLYRTSIALGCSAQPVLTVGSDIAGVLSTSTDGRERLALSFSNNQYLLQSHLLVYGLFRWASKGMFLGEQRHYLNVDIDDWFNTYDMRATDGTITFDHRNTVADVINLRDQQNALRSTFPLANGFTYNLAYNGGDVDAVTTGDCAADGSSVNVTATTRCIANQFRWINHTYSHPELNFTTYAASAAEITNNRTVATALGLAEAANVLKTPEYSGLGVYSDDPNNDITPPTDHGLGASNPNLLQAAADLGITYLHGNMSFTSHKPACFNCGIVNPVNPAITVVPDFPTNIAYHVTNPDQEASFYNSYYGPNGLFPYWSRNLTYAEALDYETSVALSQLATGAINTHTFHIANMVNYGSGQTLVTDWVSQVVAKYSALYAVPLLNTDWSTLGQSATARSNHFAQLSAGVDAVYDPVTNSVTLSTSATSAGAVQVTGVTATGSTLYGTDNLASVALTPGTPVTVTAAPRS